MSMRARPARPLLALILGAVLILSSAPAVLCVHADGRTSVESGSEPCCAPVPGAPDATPGLTRPAGTADGCSGCTDVALPSDGQRPRAVGDPMVSLPAACILPAPACRAGSALSPAPSLLEDDASPPLGAPLRI
jgi:hypothetical protein